MAVAPSTRIRLVLLSLVALIALVVPRRAAGSIVGGRFRGHCTKGILVGRRGAVGSIVGGRFGGRRTKGILIGSRGVAGSIVRRRFEGRRTKGIVVGSRGVVGRIGNRRPRGRHVGCSLVSVDHGGLRSINIAVGWRRSRIIDSIFGGKLAGRGRCRCGFAPLGPAVLVALVVAVVLFMVHCRATVNAVAASPGAGASVLVAFSAGGIVGFDMVTAG